MKIAYSIDWLTMTIPGVTMENELGKIADVLFRSPNITPCKPSHGYKWACRTAEGMIIQSGVREDMATNVICSGAALAEYAGIWTRQDWIQDILLHARGVSRIDLAIDIRGKAIISELETLVKAGNYQCPARSFKIIQSQNKGETIYLGERSSERMLRIYDKAAQTGDASEEWTRIELEVKGEAAKRCAADIKMHGLPATCVGWIRAYADFDNPVWQEAVTQTDIVYIPSRRDTKNTDNWLIFTIAPLMARMTNAGHDKLLEQFLQEYNRHLS